LWPRASAMRSGQATTVRLVGVPVGKGWRYFDVSVKGGSFQKRPFAGMANWSQSRGRLWLGGGREC
jgi:hypothetical protein